MFTQAISPQYPPLVWQPSTVPKQAKAWDLRNVAYVRVLRRTSTAGSAGNVLDTHQNGWVQVFPPLRRARTVLSETALRFLLKVADGTHPFRPTLSTGKEGLQLTLKRLLKNTVPGKGQIWAPVPLEWKRQNWACPQSPPGHLS